MGTRKLRARVNYRATAQGATELEARQNTMRLIQEAINADRTSPERLLSSRWGEAEQSGRLPVFWTMLEDHIRGGLHWLGVHWEVWIEDVDLSTGRIQGSLECWFCWKERN